MQIIPGQMKTAQLHNYLQGAVAPRPICFASTLDKDGRPNLSPFSFFNLFGSNPPTLIFSPSRRVRDNTTKHTLENILETMEVVINVVTYSMVQQTSLSSCEYPKGINEFEKSGFTPIASEKVKPFRVKESPVQFECIVREVLPQGKEGGAGNLIICEPVLIHINDAVLNENGAIDPHKIDLVARMGGDYYCRASGAAVFEVAKPITELGIGIDALPASIRQSCILTGNNLGQLANVQQQPVVDPAFEDDHLKNIIQYYSITPDEMEKELHRHAQRLLESGRVQDAWQVLLAGSF
ncbi:flavin reductase family protein [Chitinophaga sp. S165]|uniref:flavin reductase family protein n=1 Tax=Chitinophaga sp. S165 TaxID=2135462 RepID=UPI000D71A3A2|nr:flavin reductase family protein [Chitinophaga sp. S165]PWV54129.1 flavin reductase (DIM6/NTAB) family NADH-FMN oxidoreductase RutF [Chitinophaga sp. S165]